MILMEGRLRVHKGASIKLQDGIREFDRQALHAKELELIHPASRELIGWTSDLPSDMQCLLEILADG